MESTLPKNQSPMLYLSVFMTWVQQTGRPFLRRWWIWIALLVSLAYLTHYFGQSTLEERVNETVRFTEQHADEVEKNAVGRVGYQTGYFMGSLINFLLKGWRAILMSGLLILALLHLQYTYLFHRFFEQGKSSRWWYITFVFIGWLILAMVFASWVGPVGTQSGLHWTMANLFIVLNIGYSLFISWRNSSRRQLLLIQERTQAELNAFKAQVNPHFLFNSLNNIYGTAMQEDSPRTAESIQQLSGIVRYVMEESRLQTTNIQRELRFIDDYVELQRMRLPNQSNIDIQTRVEWDEKPAQIAPLLLNPLIENAFKYGISIQKPCFVHIHLQVKNQVLHLSIENSILPRTGLEEGTGLGLTNVRQRLLLAYPNKHSLTATEKDSVFYLDLSITF